MLAMGDIRESSREKIAPKKGNVYNFAIS